jgi:tRNA (mo5U34)-methyltransferase
MPVFSGHRRAEIEQAVASHASWYHRIELGHGIVTPGCHDSQLARTRLEQIGLPERCDGKRALDVGARDGFFSFELERRGARVVAVDYAPPEITGFAVASSILGSHVEYHTENVYKLDPERHGRFDLVLFLGVIYHLRNPLAALDALRSVCNEGADLFVESQLATDAVATRAAPLWRFYPRDSLFGDASNKWAPNLNGLRAAVEEAQFRVVSIEAHRDRGLLHARAVFDEKLEHARRIDAGAGLWGT